MTDKDLIEKLLEGASLRTVMVPDEKIPSNYPEHIETLELPHLVLNGNYLWGKSEPGHGVYHLGEKVYPACSFCYTNITDIFCSYTPSTNCCVFMNKKRYRKHTWSVRENYRLAWDSDTIGNGSSTREKASTEIIKKEIERASKFKIALLDSEGMWNIHPIELPMYYAQEKSFVLNSPGDQYPIFFRAPNEILDFQKKNDAFFNTDLSESASGLKCSDMQAFYSFYVVKSDGSYHSAYDIPRGTSQSYQRLKVFVERS